MTHRSDPLAVFVAMTVMRFAKDREFRLRLLAEADETPREAAYKIRRDDMVAARRRTAS